MNTWLERARELWHKIFFWHPDRRREGSAEFKPEAHHDHALVLAVAGPKTVPRWKQLRFVNRVFAPKEQKIFWVSFAVFWLALGAGAVDLIRPHVITVPAEGGSLTEALVGTPKLINPLFAPSNDVDRDLSALIYSGLFRLDQDFQPEPDLAKDYRWLPDGKTLEINLREDARFHDGQPVTSDDVVFTYQQVKNPNWRSPLANTFRDVHVIRIDDATVQVQTDAPHPNLLSELTLGILPAHVWQDVSDTSANLAEANLKPIGSGPYQVDSFTRDAKGGILLYHLKRFPAYYGLPPYIDDRLFYFYPDRTQAEDALRGNQVDALAFVPWAEAQPLTQGFQAATLELPQETVAFFNVTDPLLKTEAVRQALSLAVDRQELVGLIDPHFHAVTSPYPFLDSGTSTAADLTAARALLDGAGWKLPEGGTVRELAPAPPPTPSKKSRGAPPTAPPPTHASSTPLVLTIDVPNQPDLLTLADLLQRRWSLLGAQVRVRTQEPESLLRQVTNDRASYQILLWNILLSPDQDLAPFWSSANAAQNGLNFSNLADRDVDLAMDAVKQASSTAALAAARQNLSNVILSKYAAVFLLRPAYAYVVSKRVHGVTDLRIARPSDRLDDTAGWYVKTGWRWQ